MFCLYHNCSEFPPPPFHEKPSYSWDSLGSGFAWSPFMWTLSHLPPVRRFPCSLHFASDLWILLDLCYACFRRWYQMSWNLDLPPRSHGQGLVGRSKNRIQSLAYSQNVFYPPPWPSLSRSRYATLTRISCGCYLPHSSSLLYAAP